MVKDAQVAYNAGRDMFNKGWAKACPYTKTSRLTPVWWRGWYDKEKKKAAISSG